MTANKRINLSIQPYLPVRSHGLQSVGSQVMHNVIQIAVPQS